jgi:molybdopterin synthase sulfur carrier subunit
MSIFLRCCDSDPYQGHSVQICEEAMVIHRGLVAWTRILHVSDQLPRGDVNENEVTVRYWASARAAAGIAEEKVAAGTLGDLLDEISRRHRDRDRFDDVISTCSILVGDTPVGAREPATVTLHAGDSIEFLPPFAGG